MADEIVLSIRGYRDEPVPNRFMRPRDAIDALAVLLPGFGYTLDMPLFYYAENLLLERGWDVLRVETAYNRRPDFGAADEAVQQRWLYVDAEAAYRAALAQRDHGRVALVGKSLGTLAMGHLLTMADRPAAPVHAVWLTPALGATFLGPSPLRAQIAEAAVPSLFVIGTADPHYDAAVLADLTGATGGEAVVVPGADHGMDLPGDPVASVRAVEQTVAALTRFLPA